jgi:D-2-hydroxyacid dehydrogenase (NADP+)
MPVALVSGHFITGFGDELHAVAARAGQSLELITLPGTPGARLDPAECTRFDCAFADREIRFNEQLSAAFTDAIQRSKKLKWAHLSSSGVAQLPYFGAIRKTGAIITSSTGSNAEPVAQTGFAGLLMLARGFARYMRGQQRHEWLPMRGAELPHDLRGQTVLLIGVGAIGRVFAGYARVFGLMVIGVRRSPATPDDPVDEMHPPSRLPELLPRADWIVIACPLTPETRNLIDAAAFERMRKAPA